MRDLLLPLFGVDVDSPPFWFGFTCVYTQIVGASRRK
jgi:hypothetical protein